MGRRAPRRPLGLAVGAILTLFLASCRDHVGSQAPPGGGPRVQLLGRRMLTSRTETRQIVFGGGSRVNLIDGWSIDEWNGEAELSFVWATAREASLWFQILQIEDQQVLVTLRSFPTTPSQTIVVLVNGRDVAHLAPETIFLEYRFVIPAAAIQVGKNRLTFRHGELGKPAGAPPESRSLAVAYASILMGPQCLPLRGFGPPTVPHVETVGRRLTGPLLVIGPAELRGTLVVPGDAVLRYELALPPKSKSPALTRVRVLDDKGLHEVVEAKVSRGPIHRSGRRRIEADLSPWRGKRIDLVIEILPEPCRYATTTAILEQAGIF